MKIWYNGKFYPIMHKYIWECPYCEELTYETIRMSGGDDITCDHCDSTFIIEG